MVEKFSDFYYSSGLLSDMKWRNIPILKNPCDLWMIIDLIWSLKPVVILETGTHYGGSATFLSDITKLFGSSCTVITIDINPKMNFDPSTKEIISLVGYSTDNRLVNKVEEIITDITNKTPGNVMVMLDSDHTESNVREELRLYNNFVTIGSYLIVEDTNINGHPSFPSHGSGPWEAVQKFLLENDNFIIDHECQKYLLTFNPSGWLKRIR